MVQGAIDAVAARVLARFGPKLPRMLEDLLIRQAEVPQPLPARRGVPLVWAAFGAVIVLGAGLWLGQML